MNHRSTLRNLVPLNSNKKVALKLYPAACVILICAAALLATGCNPLPPRTREAYNAEMNTWVGRPLDDAKRAWGPPEAETRLSNNHRLVRFKRMLPMGIAKGRCFTTFDVNPEGNIVSQKSEGPACKLRPKVK